ncbi:hypothetical protein ACFVW2_09385 [Streptomyces sp. NPDC058171]
MRTGTGITETVVVHDNKRTGQPSVPGEFTVPGVEAGSGHNHEAFHLTGTPGRLTAAWAHRGQDEDPAVLYTAALDWRSLTFGPRRSAEIRVSFPPTHVRHISDLAVSPSGRVTVTSASDPGDGYPATRSRHWPAPPPRGPSSARTTRTPGAPGG